MKVLVIGGTRYFGKRLVHHLINEGHQIWVMSRGHILDDFGEHVHRLKADRNDKSAMKKAIEGLGFDVVVDQLCMNAQQATDAIEEFAGKTDYYLMTSTLSVYPWGEDLKEEVVDPLAYSPQTAESPAEIYAEGKRAAEHAFASQGIFACGFARFPVVFGEDDYTKRLYDQVQKIKNGDAIYYPNLQARFSFINSEDASKALLWMLQGKRKGAYNFASEETLRLSELIQKIELATGKKANLAMTASPETLSPFGIPQDWCLNVEKADKEGFRAEPLSKWLEPLIRKMV